MSVSCHERKSSSTKRSAPLYGRPSIGLSYGSRDFELPQWTDGVRSIVRLSCQFHSRRSLIPGVVVAGESVAAFKKRDHIFLVKGLVAGVTEVGWDAREIKINPITPGDRINTIEISDPLVFDQRGD